MTTSVGDQINGALRLIGKLAEGETPSAETSADCLTAFNQMIDSWNTERLSVYATQDQTFTWPASTRTRTLGPSGDFVGTRPVDVDDSTYFIYSNLSYPITFLNEDQYNAIALKGSTSTFPQFMWVNMDMPDITMRIWPVPTNELEMHIISVVELDQPATLATTLVIPPGYLRAFRFNLGVEIASEFGEEPPPKVSRIAAISKRNIKRINNPNDLMTLPYPLIGRRKTNYNIFSGQPQ